MNARILPAAFLLAAVFPVSGGVSFAVERQVVVEASVALEPGGMLSPEPAVGGAAGAGEAWRNVPEAASALLGLLGAMLLVLRRLR